ncbi:STAS/SEC14 domain-containing protein [Flavobacterium sp.]|uniref:STAS/SEC14 domain-containing protein n=1 Tax=Flavobacterium sp. TaxID=239 RepID=UPI00375199EB
MIVEIANEGEKFVGFKAVGSVNADDFKSVVIPIVEAFVEKHKTLNYLLQINTELSNFTVGAWLQDAVLGIKVFSKWNRAAIVTDTEGIKTFTELFSKIMIGEFKCFKHDEMEAAVTWVSRENITP